jgi:hypothetical protein
MDEKAPRPQAKKAESARKARLKAALKANLGRRKAQAKARAKEDRTGKEEG